MKFKVYLTITLYALSTLSYAMEEKFVDKKSHEYFLYQEDQQHAHEHGISNTQQGNRESHQDLDYLLQLSHMPALVPDTELIENLSEQKDQERTFFITQDDQTVTLSGQELAHCKTLQNMATFAEPSTTFDSRELPRLPMTKDTFEQLQACLYHLIGNDEASLRKNIKGYEFPHLGRLYNAADFVGCKKLLPICYKTVIKRLLLRNRYNGHNAQNLLRGFNLNESLLFDISKEIMKQNDVKSIIQKLSISLKSKTEHFMDDLQMSPQGTIAYRIDNDNYTIELWNRDGKPLHTLNGHNATVDNVAFNPQETILTYCTDDEIYLWHIETGTCIQTLPNENAIESILFNPQGTLFTSQNNTSSDVLYLWSAETGQRLHRLVHPNEAETKIFNQQGTLLATYCDDIDECKIYLWDVASGICIQEFLEYEEEEEENDNTEYVPASPIIAFHPKRQLFASCSSSPTIRLWDIASGRCIQTLECNKQVESIAFNPQGTLLVACYDTTTDLWDLQTSKCIRTLNTCGPATFNPEGTQLICQSDDNTLQLWDVETGYCLESFKGYDFIYGPHNTLLINKENSIKIWSLENNWLTNLLNSINCHAALLLGYIGQQYMTTGQPVSLNQQLLETLPHNLKSRLFAKKIITIDRGYNIQSTHKRSEKNADLLLKPSPRPPKQQKMMIKIEKKS